MNKRAGELSAIELDSVMTMLATPTSAKPPRDQHVPRKYHCVCAITTWRAYRECGNKLLHVIIKQGTYGIGEIKHVIELVSRNIISWAVILACIISYKYW